MPVYYGHYKPASLGDFDDHDDYDPNCDGFDDYEPPDYDDREPDYDDCEPDYDDYRPSNDDYDAYDWFFANQKVSMRGTMIVDMITLEGIVKDLTNF